MLRKRFQHHHLLLACLIHISLNVALAFNSTYKCNITCARGFYAQKHRRMLWQPLISVGFWACYRVIFLWLISMPCSACCALFHPNQTLLPHKLLTLWITLMYTCQIIYWRTCLPSILGHIISGRPKGSWRKFSFSGLLENVLQRQFPGLKAEVGVNNEIWIEVGELAMV